MRGSVFRTPSLTLLLTFGTFVAGCGPATEPLSREPLRAEIVEVTVREIYSPKTQSSSLNYLVRLRLPGEHSASLMVSHSPAPQVGECMPVILERYAEDRAQVWIDLEPWRMGDHACPQWVNR